MKRCMYCGTMNENSSETCSKCGNPLLDITSGQEGEAAAEETFTGGQEEYSEPAAPEEAVPQEAAADDAQDVPQEEGQAPYEEQAPYTEQAPYGEQAPYEQQPPYGGQAPYEEQPPYGGQAPYGQAPYGEQSPYGGQAPYGDPQYGGQAYGYEGQAPYMGEDQEEQGRGGKNEGGSQRLMITARKRVKSFLFFLVTFFCTAMVGANIYDAVTGNVSHVINAYQDIIHNAFGTNAAVSFMNGIVDIAEDAGDLLKYGSAAALYLPLVFMCLGMWIMFFQTHRGEEPISTSGYMLCRIMLVFRFLVECVVLAACLIVSVAFVVAAGASSSMASILVGIVLLIIMIVIAVLTVMYYVLVLHAAKVIHNNARNGRDRGRISAYVPVMTLILALISAAAMLPMAPDDYIGLAARGSVVAWYFFASIWLFAYRGTVKK